jgi:hypothetical protein
MLGERHADVRAAFGDLNEVGAGLGLEWKLSKDRGRNSWGSWACMLSDIVCMEMRVAPPGQTCPLCRHRSAGTARVEGSGACAPYGTQSVVGRLTLIIARACRWGGVPSNASTT